MLTSCSPAIMAELRCLLFPLDIGARRRRSGGGGGCARMPVGTNLYLGPRVGRWY
jgi:hypothetical protein